MWLLSQGPILNNTIFAAKSLQSCLTLYDPIDGSPPGSAVPGILQARTLEWVAISFSNAWKWKVRVKSLSWVWLFGTPWTAAHQAPPSMGFSRQEYWSGVPLPSPNTIFRGVLTPEGCNAQMKGVGVRRNIIQSIATCISKQSQTKLLCNANGSLHTPSSKWRSPKYECESLGSTCLLILSVLVFFFFSLATLYTF